MNLIIAMLFIVSSLISPLSVGSVSAHAPGQPQIVSVNEKFPSTYIDLFIKRQTSLMMPDEIAPELYLVNQPIRFKSDRELMGLPLEATKDIKFVWDYGDGSKTEVGDTPTHTYAKTGSYGVSVLALANNGQRSPIESILINVVPNNDYVLPRAKMSLSGPYTDSHNYYTHMSEPVTFDASLTQIGTSSKLSYAWTATPKVTGSEKVFTTSFPETVKNSVVVLQVTDENGLISQDYGYLADTSKKPSALLVTATESGSLTDGLKSAWPLIVGAIVVCIVTFKLFFRQKGILKP